MRLSEGLSLTPSLSLATGDAELVADVVRGDARAFVVVWRRYSRLVRHILRLELGPDPVCDDLVQEVFLAFVRSAKDLHDGAALRSYLATVTVRLARYELRSRRVRRVVTLVDTGILPAYPVPPTDVEGRDALRVLGRTLEKLSRRRRSAFLLRHVQGLSLAEIATALGTSESTVKRELLRARHAVARRLRSEPSFRDYCVTLLSS